MKRATEPRIIPSPVKMETTGGHVVLGPGWRVQPDPGLPLATEGDLLSRWLRQDAPETKGPSGSARLWVDTTLAGQGYRLRVEPARIELAGGSAAGVFAGIQTLKALTEKTGRKPRIPCVTVEDAPAMALRAMHLDMKTQMHRFEDWLALIDRLAELKFNAVVVEYEDKFPYSRRSEVVHPEALTADQVRRMQAFAAARHVDVIPLVQTIGHLEFALTRSGYEKLRELPEAISDICPLNEDGYRLAADLVTDVVEGHPEAKFIHLGGDESWHLGSCPRCQEKVRRQGRSALYVDHMTRLCRIVIDAGKRPMVWADMVLAHPEALRAMPRETVMVHWQYAPTETEETDIMRWGQPRLPVQREQEAPEDFRTRFRKYYADRPDFPARAKAFFYTAYLRDEGFEVVCAHAIRSWGDPWTNPSLVEHVSNIRGLSREAHQDGAMGTLLTSWPVRRCLWETQWYGIAAAAEYSWRPAEKHLADFDARFMRQLYGISDAGAAEAMWKLSRWEDHVDWASPRYDGSRRLWMTRPLSESLDLLESGKLRGAGEGVPPEEWGARARAAEQVFARAAKSAARYTDDLATWTPQAREIALRMDLFQFYRELTQGNEDPKAAAELLARGGAFYAELRTALARTLSPGAVDEEIECRWAQDRKELTTVSGKS